MKNSLLIFLVMGLSLVVVVWILFSVSGRLQDDKLVGPNLVRELVNQSSPSPSPEINAPKTFQFDETTDLNVELEKVNPTINNEDFK